MDSIVARALASEWPYDPRFRVLSRHPSIKERYTQIAASHEYAGGIKPPDEAILWVISTDARKRLRNRRVVHFEVFIEDHGYGWRALVEKPGAITREDA